MNDGRGDGFGRKPFHPGMDDGHFETMPRYSGTDDGHFETMPRRPGMDDGHFETMPLHPGMDDGRFETMPRHPGMDGRRGPGEWGGRGHGGRHGGPHGPGMPEDLLAERIDAAELPELLELAGRMVRHRPGGDAGRGQALALSILAGRESLSQRALQQLMGVRPGSLSELLSKLERKGLVTRERGEDRRGNLLRITEAGRAALPDGDAAPEDALFDALTEAQRDSLRELLRTLLKAWAEDAPAPRGCDRQPWEAPALPGPQTEKV